MDVRQSPVPESPAVSAPKRKRARERAADIRYRARRVLDARTVGVGSHRLTLILALVLLITVAVGGYAVSMGAYAVGYLLVGDALWLYVAFRVMEGLIGLLVLLPLGVSLFRLACLMVLQTRSPSSPPELPVTGDIPELNRVFYPFTSLRAYGRCMAVGLETLGWTALWVGLPLVGFRLLASIFDYMANRGVLAQLCDLLTVLSLIACLAFGVLMLFLSGYRAGFGYFVFMHDRLPLGEVNRYFRGFKRSFVRPFVLRFSLSGWIVLSIVAVLVPFVLHTVPYGLCCGAMYGAELEKCD